MQRVIEAWNRVRKAATGDSRIVLFLLANAALFIRPAELHPALSGLPVYKVCMLACLAGSFPAVVRRLTARSLASRPLDACVLAILPAIILSHLANLEPRRAWGSGVAFANPLLYYFLLVSVVDTPARLQRFLTGLAAFALAITALTVLHYYGVVDVPTIQFEEWPYDRSIIRRLETTGLFSDPNDLCLMLVMAMSICLYLIFERRRWCWALPLSLFGHALWLTHSRGGFLAMLAALVVLMVSRLGLKALPVAALALLNLLLAFAGRQTSFGDAMSGGTGTTRLRLWSKGLDLLADRPLFGIGAGRYQEFAGKVAHNSFIHCYAELGILGGTLFFGAFFLAIWPLLRPGWRAAAGRVPDGGLWQMRPYILAIVAGHAAGLMSLSCAYTIPTYTVLGLSAAYQGLAEDRLGVPTPRLDAGLVLRVALTGAGFLAASYGGLRLLLRLD